MEERITKLKNQVNELMEWKKQNSIQQIPFNPPASVRSIMYENHFVVTGKISTTVPFFDTWLEVNFDDQILFMPATLST